MAEPTSNPSPTPTPQLPEATRRREAHQAMRDAVAAVGARGSRR